MTRTRSGAEILVVENEPRMEAVAESLRQTCGPKSVTLLGLGNIGGYTAGLLARVRGVAQLTLVDRDTCDETNLVSQDIVAADVGRPKAVVQAERLRRINPQLQVEALVDDLANVPLGLLQADVLVACLDSLRARQFVNQFAWRLNRPWVDAGVHADGCLARVNVYVPAVNQPCLECAFDDSHYAAIEQSYPCQGEAPAPAATNAPASLGALAAALQVIECQKLLSGRWEHALIGRQVVVDAAAHRHFVTSFRRNDACRFDHATWSINTLEQQPGELRVADLFSRLSDAGAPDCGLHVEGQVFVKRLTCPSCGDTRAGLCRLSGRLGDAQLCHGCQRRMVAAGFDMAVWLRADDLPPDARDRPLTDLGFRTGDVVTVRAGDAERHWQLGVGKRHRLATAN